MNFNDLTDEQKAQARACSTPEDILALAKSAGYKLSDDQLEKAFSKSDSWDPFECSPFDPCYAVGCQTDES